MDPLVVLTIAGSDSSGGAGLQADLRTFAALGVHGAVAVSAITAQNTTGVTAVLAAEPEMVRAQVEAVTEDLSVAAVKTGMLARPATVLAVAGLAEQGRLPHLVVDPVLVSSTGHLLMEPGGVDAYRDALFRFAEVLTPNLREAAVLLGTDVAELSSTAAMADAGRALLATGARCVVVKGGHLLAGADTQDPAQEPTQDRAADVVVDAQGSATLDGPRVATRNDHGTGCSLAAAVAVGLAEGLAPRDAAVRAKRFVADALAGGAAWTLGHGHGPIDHLGWTARPPARP